MIDDTFDFFIMAFLFIVSAALCVILVFAVMDGMSTASGPVIDKYYDDEDLVCSKGCTVVPECWTIVIGNQAWWNEETCVSKETYDSLSIGDYYTE